MGRHRYARPSRLGLDHYLHNPQEFGRWLNSHEWASYEIPETALYFVQCGRASEPPTRTHLPKKQRADWDTDRTPRCKSSTRTRSQGPPDGAGSESCLGP